MTTDEQNKISQITKALSDSQNILLFPHSRADGDGLGSMLALGRALSAMNKQVRKILFDKLAPRYEFLADEDSLLILNSDITIDSFNDADTLVILDTAVSEQLEPILDFLSHFTGRTIIIDHHSHRDIKADIVWQDTNASATGIMIAELLQAMPLLTDSKIADYLLIAIASDTGWFRYGNTDADCFRWAARLIESGADNHQLYEKLFRSDSPQRFKLIARALNSAEFYADNRIVILTLTLNDFEQTHASHSETENIIDQACGIKSLEVALLFVEQDENKVRISLRSRSNIDVNKFAQRFGGGGHPRAAGIKLTGTIEQAKAKILSALTEQFTDKIPQEN